MKFFLLFYPNNIFIAKVPNVYLIKLINFSNIFKKSGGAEPSLGGGKANLGGGKCPLQQAQTASLAERHGLLNSRLKKIPVWE